MRWNRRAAMLCGGEQHVPRSIGERLHGAIVEPIVTRTDPILAALRSASSLHETQAVLDAGDQHIAVSVSIEPIREADGSPVAALAICQAILSTQAATVSELGSEQSRLQAEDRTDRVLAVLAHEMRGPLAALLTAVRLLEVKGRLDPEALRLLATVLRQSLLLARLVDDLLEIGRLVTGKLQLQRARTELDSVLNQAAETCAPLINQRRHTLVVTTSREPLHLDVDPARIVQVLCNLLTNAARYMQEGGQIELFADGGDGTAIIRVRDQGVGIAPEMLMRIFDRFVQADATSRTPAEAGLGVGLWLVKAIVELHGGRVEAHSEGIGRGSEFVVRLPLAS